MMYYRTNMINGRVITVILAILMTISCGDEATQSNGLGTLSGVWELSTTVNSNTCGILNGSLSTESLILVQCSGEVSIISGGGLWGIGTIDGENLEFSGSEIITDETDCRSTRTSTGTLSGTSTLLEGTFTTTIAFDADSCTDLSDCTIETSARLSLIAAYQSSCVDRDEFGDPAESEYILPWPVGKSYFLNNSYCIPTGGHRQQQAYDFLIPIGDTIVAARAGVVRQIKENSPDNGQGSDHNHVMIEHMDGTVAFYAHLKQAGVIVNIGENIHAGQPIALAGHSGTDDVVHLHFGVYDYYPPQEGDDRAVNFRNMDGPVDCRGGLVKWETYTAQ
jgi:hypothetical protein